MTEVVRAAGQTIGEGDPRIMARVTERVKILQYQWMMHRTRTRWARPILLGIRALGRRLPFFRA
jgi:hypothetical protein